VRLLFAAVGGLSRLGAALGSLATIVTLGLVALSVFARYALGRPMPWIDEVAGWFVVALVMLAVAEAQARGEHIGIDPPARIAASRLGRVAQMEDGVEAFGVQVDTPRDGDAVLMLCRGRPSHIGVFCIVDGERCVLHAMENLGMVVLHRLRDLSKCLLMIESFYRWK
jgi:hypothetical protein